MEFLGSIFTYIFSGMWQGILGVFGMSKDQKLGRAEVRNADLELTAKRQAAIDKIALNTPSDKDVDERLGKGGI